MDLKLKYEVTGAGWATAEFTMPHKSISIEISYLSDPLPELLKAIVKINNGELHFSAITFYDEPGRCLLQITNISKKNVQLAFYTHEDCWIHHRIPGKTKDQNFSELIENDIHFFTHITTWQCSKKELTEAVTIAIENLLLQTTTKKYREEWGSPFPAKWYNLLKMQ